MKVSATVLVSLVSWVVAYPELVDSGRLENIWVFNFKSAQMHIFITLPCWIKSLTESFLAKKYRKILYLLKKKKNLSCVEIGSITVYMSKIHGIDVLEIVKGRSRETCDFSDSKINTKWLDTVLLPEGSSPSSLYEQLLFSLQFVLCWQIKLLAVVCS